MDFTLKAIMGRLNRSGQAAMEFLMTYGWAILVVLVVIAAMSYFGVLDPSNVVPDRCYLGEKFECTDYRFETSGGSGVVYLLLTNKFNQPITVTGLNISTPNGDCFVGDYIPLSANLLPWDSLNPGPIPCNNALSGIGLRIKMKFKLAIQYTLPDSSIAAARVDSGEIITKIER
ncbi:MAG TPA: hypothetical protein VJB90_05495 [Candidatus Nanoarchaeia archaeon]|nr:hypothetical protein [Candidatus Nanoarchaeia archaeon]